MRTSDHIFSCNNYFKLGVSSLLTPELIDERYCIIDCETVDASEVLNEVEPCREVVAFISNDIDYFTLKNIANMTFIDINSSTSAIMSSFYVPDSKYLYQARTELTERELQVLSFIKSGYPSHQAFQKLGMKLKTFYVHRRSLILKLRTKNRISLYTKIMGVRGTFR